MKSAFLYGDLQEQRFIDQPPGYVKLHDEHKIYELKKALYRLNAALKACTIILMLVFFKKERF